VISVFAVATTFLFFLDAFDFGTPSSEDFVAFPF
jgi:hypothetical protein